MKLKLMLIAAAAAMFFVSPVSAQTAPAQDQKSSVADGGKGNGSAIQPPPRDAEQDTNEEDSDLEEFDGEDDDMADQDAGIYGDDDEDQADLEE